VTDVIRDVVMKEADGATIKKVAVANGMKTLRDDGIRKVFEGETTFEEVMRVTSEDSR